MHNEFGLGFSPQDKVPMSYDRVVTQELDLPPKRRRFPWPIIVICGVIQEIVAIVLILSVVQQLYAAPAFTPKDAVYKYQSFLNGHVEITYNLAPHGYWQYESKYGDSLEEEIAEAADDASRIFSAWRYRYDGYRVTLTIKESEPMELSDNQGLSQYLYYQGVNPGHVQACERLTIRADLHGGERDKVVTGRMYAIQIDNAWYLVSCTGTEGSIYNFVVDYFLYNRNW